MCEKKFAVGSKIEKSKYFKMYRSTERFVFIYLFIYFFFFFFFFTYMCVSSCCFLSENICGTRPYEWGPPMKLELDS